MKNPYEAYILIEVFCIAFALYNLFRLKKGYNIGKEKPILTKIIICFLVLVCTDIIQALATGGICPLPHWIFTLDYFFSLLVTGMGCYYWALFVEARIGSHFGKVTMILFQLPMFFLGLLNFISIFTGWTFYADANGIYSYGDLFIVQEIVPCLYLLISVIRSIYGIVCAKDTDRRVEFCAYIIFVIIDYISISFEDYYETVPLFELMILLSIQTLFFTVYLDSQYAYAQRERELADSRAAMMISQIQPHFIYNVLSVIRSMCKDKAPDAAETVTEFADYLRGNLDSLDIKEPIPFMNELKHTEVFLALEKKRFGDRIHVTYDIQTDNFCIPALCLQPIVENAVKHGLLVREEGGSIHISTKETEQEYVVSVEDDGVGFDIHEKKEDGRSHIGIKNVQERLAYLSHGTLEIHSETGHGTTCLIRIPKVK